MAKKTKKAARKPVKKAKMRPMKAKAKKAAPKKAKKAAKKGSKLSPDQLMAKVRGKVEGFLKKLYKRYEKHDDDRYLVFEGTTAIQTVLRPWHRDDVVVESFAYVVQDPRIDENLLRFLLRENAMMHFGAFGLTFDGTIIFSHSLAGANLDENEFVSSIKSVAKISDYYDERIVQMAGGMTARDAMKKGII